MNALKYSWVALLGMVLAGCVESDSERLDQQSEQDILAYAQANNLNVNKAESGIYYQTSFSTTTPEYKEGDRVAFRYKEFRLIDGRAIDSSGTEPVYYAANAQYLVRTDRTRKLMSPGLIQGLRLLQPGGTAVLLVPSRLAYPNGGNPAVPPNGSVRLDVQLLSVTSEEQQIEQYILRNPIDITEKTADGLRFALIKSAQGDSVKTGTSAQVRYTGKLLDGSQFDSGTNSFQLNQVVKGFSEGLKKMKVGERAILIFPSAFGYAGSTSSQQFDATTRKYTIPPYSPLVFDVEVLSITK